MEADYREDLFRKIGELQTEFSPKQRVLADYMVKNYLSLAYVTVSELAHQAGVSEATVIRFVYVLGYKGFPDFMEALRMEIDRERGKTGSLNRYRIDQTKYTFPKDTFRAIFDLEISTLEDTLANINEADFERAVRAIAEARMLIIAAWGANKSHSQAAAFAFEVLRPNVHQVEDLAISEASLLHPLPEGAVGLVFSSPRYPTVTQQILETMKEQNAFIIGVSDSVMSPIAPFCDVLFQVPEKFVTFIDTNGAYMAIIHALAFGVYLRDVDHAKQRINEYNAFSKAYGFYVHDFLELIDFNHAQP